MKSSNSSWLMGLGVFVLGTAMAFASSAGYHPPQQPASPATQQGGQTGPQPSPTNQPPGYGPQGQASPPAMQQHGASHAKHQHKQVYGGQAATQPNPNQPPTNAS
ncbi:hypothetical protein HHS34_009180 [Acidithiobacillus montserratensis]|uniref:Uncharacterized protein n=1 Tax=Acidithiobacillus montserratensis TaxID=2729135 RepID=A0ACD5HFD2_9PROT|nr:hypothetical protein [Acidithiobacillus montserratensis]MBU2748194.1 hypothetical protein [Acidithiobacillus montserratensis]